MADEIRFDEELNLGSRGGAVAWCEYAATRVLLGTLGRMPRPAQRALLRAVAEVATVVDRRHSKAAREYLAQALGPQAGRERWRVVRAYQHLFQLSLDSDAFARRVPQERLLEHYAITADERVLAAMRAGTGGIMVTPHVGDWEAGAAVMPHLGMRPTYAVAKPPKNRYLSRRLLRLREAKRVHVMPRRGGMQQAAAILERGGWIAMLLDQRARKKYAVAPFFGRLANCERGAAVLIKRLRVPIVFGACYLTERPFCYDLRFPTLLTPEELADLSLDEIVRVVNAEQERLILERPEQYFWLHDRYRDAPAPVPESGAAGPGAAAPGPDGEVAPEGDESPSTARARR